VVSGKRGGTYDTAEGPMDGMTTLMSTEAVKTGKNLAATDDQARIDSRLDVSK